ncbi:hypothetical protein [Christiangramia forsetii]|uniref:Membrane protein n=2 Tax=Christiangramia forsetii TaxID=411153 RepID=A0LYR7_CHRFK|nr:hypothetical protein [Christiangramia forsetii]GGG33548.1 hypothetical protein GCM10011532_16480 [Christiangramia forsetii]CAL65512.1 membrane protein [Christiangramia forsetii KT0803]
MEKQFDREDELMKKLLNEAVTDKPSAGFKSRIMKTVEARNAEIKPYEPLISKTGWTSITAIFLLSMIGLSYLYADISLFNDLSFEFPHLVNMPEINLSRSMQYAIAFVALFFLQVPFLKRFLDKEY